MTIAGMRFFENGPLIPGELLLARDQGRVFFFCGAGVSCAHAKLPNFKELAETVLKKLNVQKNEPAYKYFEAASKAPLPLDYLFSMLEEDFDKHFIEEAVAESLKTRDGVDLIAHETLLKLATTPEKNTQLITTNFDRLFTKYNPDLKAWVGPDLPNIQKIENFKGPIYLHGRVNEAYNAAEEGGFVLTKASFGRAYLTEAWATSFLKTLIANEYYIVFVGYTAEDPPVSYLLEALKSSSGQLNGVYAFQSGEEEEAKFLWAPKGVEAIAYENKNDHSLLWETLEAWAEKTEDNDAWQNKIIENALKGPSNLSPFQRWQVAHLVSSQEGMEKFAKNTPPPSVEWLCFFDAWCRYAEYGLDFDEKISQQMDSTQGYKIIEDSWNAFKVNELDRQNLKGKENIALFQSAYFGHYSELPSRLKSFSTWLANVSHQPIAVWWAGQQEKLHPYLERAIKDSLHDKLFKKTSKAQSNIYLAWDYIFNSWENEAVDNHRQSNILQQKIKNYGWSLNYLQEYAALTSTYLKIEKTQLPIPLQLTDDIKITDMVSFEVHYQKPNFDLFEGGVQNGFGSYIPKDRLFFSNDCVTPDLPNLPNEMLLQAVVYVRENLGISLNLKNELGGKSCWSSCGTNNIGIQGLTKRTALFKDLFKRLVAYNKEKALNEFYTWPENDDFIFSRLRLWAAWLGNVLLPTEAGKVILSLSDAAFWDIDHSEDLITIWAACWNSFTKVTKKQLEARLLQGYINSPDNLETREEQKAANTLKYMHLLSKKSFKFSLNMEDEQKKLKAKVPNWKPNTWKFSPFFAKLTSPDNLYKKLLAMPLKDIVKKAVEHEKSGIYSFKGLVAVYPCRALAALYCEAKYKNLYNEIFWNEIFWCDFLTHKNRENDDEKFIIYIARVLLKLPVNGIADIMNPVISWLENQKKKIFDYNIKIFDSLITKLIKATEVVDFSTTVDAYNTKEDDHYFALNSPIGRIFRVMFIDTRLDNISGKLPQHWQNWAENLLNSKQITVRNYTLVIFLYYLNDLYKMAADWALKNLVSVLTGEKNKDNSAAAWSGFLYGTSNASLIQ